MRQTSRWMLPFLLVCGSGVCLAQNTNSGDLRGTVTDPTGAVIPGATVTVKDVDKNVITTYTTDGAELYWHLYGHVAVVYQTGIRAERLLCPVLSRSETILTAG